MIAMGVYLSLLSYTQSSFKPKSRSFQWELCPSKEELTRQGPLIFIPDEVHMPKLFILLSCKV